MATTIQPETTTTVDLDWVTKVYYVQGGRQAVPRVHKYMESLESRILADGGPVYYLLLPRKKRQVINEEEDKPIFVTVFHGEKSEAKTRKYMALIGYGPSSNKEWGCGGSLISSRYVLSAAHCALPAVLGPARWARLGDLDISTNADDAKVQDFSIAERILHPDYKEPRVYNDIALFKLDREAAFTPWVAPVCLHTSREMPGVEATVTGWGRIEFAGETSNHLLEADLDIYNDTECRRLVSVKDRKTPRGIDSNLMFCAGKSDGSKDACSGDSGGPLVVKIPDQCLKTQIGVTSFGNMCGLPDSPGVYTRVSTYISWIEDIVFNDL